MLPTLDTHQSILVIRLSSLGDILLTTPALRCLRIVYPEARIDVVVRERYLELLQGNPHISSLLLLPEPADRKTLQDFVKEHRSRYGIVVDLHTGLRSAYLRRNLRPAMILSYRKRRIARWILVKFKKDVYGGEFSVPLAYLKALVPLGVYDDGGGLEWPLALNKKESFLEIADLKEAPNPPPIALCPGASFASKRWPIELWRELTEELLKKGHSIWVFGDQSDTEAGEHIKDVDPVRVLDFCGKLSLAETGAGLSYCKLAVTHDAGPAHMASAVGTPVVAIYGSTVTRFGFRPFRIPHRIAEIDLPCRPCSHLGFQACPLEHHNCMNDQHAADVLSRIEDLKAELVQR